LRAVAVWLSIGAICVLVNWLIFFPRCLALTPFRPPRFWSPRSLKPGFTRPHFRNFLSPPPIVRCTTALAAQIARLKDPGVIQVIEKHVCLLWLSRPDPSDFLFLQKPPKQPPRPDPGPRPNGQPTSPCPLRHPPIPSKLPVSLLNGLIWILEMLNRPKFTTGDCFMSSLSPPAQCSLPFPALVSRDRSSSSSFPKVRSPQAGTAPTHAPLAFFSLMLSWRFSKIFKIPLLACSPSPTVSSLFLSPACAIQWPQTPTLRRPYVHRVYSVSFPVFSVQSLSRGMIPPPWPSAMTCDYSLPSVVFFPTGHFPVCLDGEAVSLAPPTFAPRPNVEIRSLLRFRPFFTPYLWRSKDTPSSLIRALWPFPPCETPTFQGTPQGPCRSGVATCQCGQF